MKNVITLLMLFISVSACSQKEQKPHLNTYTIGASKTSWAWMVMNQGQPVLEVSLPDSVITIRDTMGAIKALLRSQKMTMDETYRQQQELIKWQKRFFLVQDILLYMNRDGTVNNMKKFTAAVKKYRKEIK